MKYFCLFYYNKSIYSIRSILVECESGNVLECKKKVRPKINSAWEECGYHHCSKRLYEIWQGEKV